MRILVIGSQGQLGSELEARLRKLRTPNVRVPEILISNRSDLDLTAIKNISHFLDHASPDIVVNAAAYTAVDKAESNGELAFLVNEAAVREIAIYCKRKQRKLIHISTDYVFDGKSNNAYVETDPVRPIGVYGCSKLAGENAIREFLDEHIILRTSWVFGANGNNFVKTMLRLAESKTEIDIVADQFGAPTSARAVAETVAQIVLDISDPGQCSLYWGTYHFSGLPWVSWAEFAGEIFKQATSRGILGAAPRVNPIRTLDYPTRALRPANSRMDCSKLKNAFGIDPDDWRQSLGVMLDELNQGMKR